MTIVKDIMTKDVITIKEAMNVRQICSILLKHNLSGAPVVTEKGKLAGFISERDIIGAVGKPNFLKKTAKQLMTRKVVVVEPEDPLIQASKIFAGKQIRHIPVTKNGKIVGIIARRDLINQMLKHVY